MLKRYRLWRLNRETLRLVRNNMSNISLALSYGWSACNMMEGEYGIYISYRNYEGMSELHDHLLERLRTGEV